MLVFGSQNNKLSVSLPHTCQRSSNAPPDTIHSQSPLLSQSYKNSSPALSPLRVLALSCSPPAPAIKAFSLISVFVSPLCLKPSQILPMDLGLRMIRQLLGLARKVDGCIATQKAQSAHACWKPLVKTRQWLRKNFIILS